jgi:beta-1,4-mannooligosaccharide/beta-1,4-mannosyl-N-acetylglucosamine phosphorylase
MTQTPKSTIARCEPLPSIPWEDRPDGSDAVVWRSERNPIIPRDTIPCSNTVFNSAAVPFQDGFAGVFRVDTRAYHMQLHAGFSDDGCDWRLDHDPITFQGADEEIAPFAYGYDPRVLWIEDRYWVTWCNGYHGPTIGIGWTHDFRTFEQGENAFLPYNRNGVLFPRRIGGKYAMLSRPSDRGHTPFGDVFYSESPDMVHWGRHRFVMSPRGGWESTKVGPGPCPIETDEGWLLIYHGVITQCNGYLYSAGVALLDLDEPWKVIARGRSFVITPAASYEHVGCVPNVVFPCAALVDGDTGRTAIYYGAADTVTCLAFARVDELVAFAKEAC